MVSIRSVLVSLGTALLASHSANKVAGEVGIPSSTGNSVSQVNTIGPSSWSFRQDGCFIGSAGNLVVTPFGGSTPDGAEILDVHYTGQPLCNWLSMMQSAHYSVEAAWNEEHSRRKAKTPWWNLYRKFRRWLQKFPQFEVQVEILYLDLWNKDRYGHPLPWVTTFFRYKCPSDDKSYGLLRHLCGSVFSQGSDPRVATQVHLLLQPRHGYNRPLTVSASKWQFVSGLSMGLRGSRKPEDKELQDGWAWATSLYGSAASIMTLRARINDYWMNDGRCYFKWLLQVEWKFLSETVCERLHRDANEGAISLVKAAKFDSVRLDITGLDLFSYSRPVLWGILSEGYLSVNVGSGLLRLEVDTNPQNEPNFERAKNTAFGARAANYVLGSLGKLFLNKKEE